MAERVLEGRLVRLRPVRDRDVAALATIRAAPEVAQRWNTGDDPGADVARDLSDPESECFVIEFEACVIGFVQWQEETDPDYRHGSLDIYVDPAVHSRGLGTDAVRAVVAYLIRDRGHHRVTIDPAADNLPAIRCYSKVGFQIAGTMREYERGRDGTWHDSLLMDLLASQFDPGQGA